MTCDEVRAGQDDGLTPSLLIAAGRHVQGCPDCQEWIRESCEAIDPVRREELVRQFTAEYGAAIKRSLATDPEVKS